MLRLWIEPAGEDQHQQRAKRDSESPHPGPQSDFDSSSNPWRSAEKIAGAPPNDYKNAMFDDGTV